MNPDQNTIDCGVKYFFTIDRENRNQTGKIWNEKSAIAWQYGLNCNRPRFSFSNPLCKRDFILTEMNDHAVVVIRRTSFLPSRFQILVADQYAGKIESRGFLLNQYKIQLADLPEVVFQMPLFNTLFHGQSKAGGRIWARVGPSKKEWGVLAQPQLDDFRLLAALAFIHNQWFNFS